VAPAYRRAERRSVREDLPLLAQPLQRLPMLVRHQRRDARVVRLVDGDLLDAQAGERLLAGEADELRGHVLRQLALAAGTFRVVVEVVAELRADDEVGPLGEER